MLALMSRPCHVLRVFTRGDLGGNHLGVVNDVVGLTDERKQAIATDLGFSETIFVDWTDPTRNPAVRIFTPAVELPFAGHPLIGAAWVLGAFGPAPVDGLITSVGPVSCSAVDDGATVTTTIPMSRVDDDVAGIAVKAGMPKPSRSIRLSLPKHYAVAVYDTFDQVGGLTPDMDVLADNVFGFAAFSRTQDGIKLRFFAPSAGIAEDPATGSAAIALATAFRMWGESEGSVTIWQGDEVGQPSTIELSWTPEWATIGGTVRHDEVVLVG